MTKKLLAAAVAAVIISLGFMTQASAGSACKDKKGVCMVVTVNMDVDEYVEIMRENFDFPTVEKLRELNKNLGDSFTEGDEIIIL